MIKAPRHFIEVHLQEVSDLGAELPLAAD